MEKKSIKQRCIDAWFPSSEKERIAGMWPTAAFVIVIFLGIIALMLWTTHASGSAHCKINNIEYVDVSAYGDCWISGVSAQFCPVAHDIECDVSGDIPINAKLLAEVVGGMQK